MDKDTFLTHCLGYEKDMNCDDILTVCVSINQSVILLSNIPEGLVHDNDVVKACSMLTSCIEDKAGCTVNDIRDAQQ